MGKYEGTRMKFVRKRRMKVHFTTSTINISLPLSENGFINVIGSGNICKNILDYKEIKASPHVSSHSPTVPPDTQPSPT